MAGHTYRYSVSKNFAVIAADTVQELHAQLVEFNSNPNMAAELAAFEAVSSGQAPTVQQAAQNVAAVMPVQQPAQPAAPAPAVNAGSGPETVSKYGATWTINHPDAPTCPDGTTAVLKEWTAKSSGKATKAWKHKGWLDGTQSQLDPVSKEFNQFVAG
jgi:hypothetical protein